MFNKTYEYCLADISPTKNVVISRLLSLYWENAAKLKAILIDGVKSYSYFKMNSPMSH